MTLEEAFDQWRAAVQAELDSRGHTTLDEALYDIAVEQSFAHGPAGIRVNRVTLYWDNVALFSAPIAPLTLDFGNNVHITLHLG